MTDWQPESRLLHDLDEAVPAILASQKPNGQFGTEPWISTDQNLLLPLAAAYSLPQSRHHGSAEVLDGIAHGGLALAEAQDNQGMWEFRKKDGSEWGPIRMPWAYSRWMRARALVGEQLADDVRERWDEGLQLGFDGIFEELEVVNEEQMSADDVAAARRTSRASQGYRFVRIHNIPAHHAMALYCAGTVYGRDDWRERAGAYLHAVADAQSEHGWWAEHAGPVVAYNFVYVDALGTYLAMSDDEGVLPALERAARYHAEFTYPDGSAVETVDGRNPYHEGVKLGNCGFTRTAAGRGWLARQHHLFLDDGGTFDADYAASLLLYGEGGPVEPPAGERERHDFRMGDLARTNRQVPWFACLSAIATPPPTNRWGQDRQNFLSLYHDEAGLVLGGGDTKLQPLWSSFTVGDTSLLAHAPGDEEPDFAAPSGLRHVPDEAELDGGEAPAVRLRYGDVTCRLALDLTSAEQAVIDLSQEGGGADVAAHVTCVVSVGESLRAHDGSDAPLSGEGRTIDGAEGGWIEHGNWRLDLPAGATATWPVLPHNPYRKDGHAEIEEARLVVSVPLASGTPVRLTLRVG
jgi:hypothetical protein